MKHQRGFPAWWLLLVMPACAQPSQTLTATDSTQVVAEAQQFMREYATELLAGNRKAIAARYDRTGSHAIGNGMTRWIPYDSVVAQYASEQWKAPSAFEWQDLSFEPITRDAIVVAGRFRWGMTPTAAVNMSYVSLLRRQDGVLRIRLEDESVNPMDVPKAPADTSRSPS